MFKREKYHKAPFGKGVIISTIICTIIFVPLMLISYYSNPFVFLILFLALVVYPFALPLGFRIGYSEIIIRRIIWDVHIPFTTITDAVSAEDQNLKATPFSSIGLRGWFGYRCIIHLRRVGWVSMYTKKTTDLVLISSSRNKYLIAPDSAEDFIEDLRSGMNNVGLPLGDKRYDEEGFTEDGGGEEPEFAEVVDY